MDEDKVLNTFLGPSEIVKYESSLSKLKKESLD